MFFPSILYIIIVLLCIGYCVWSVWENYKQGRVLRGLKPAISYAIIFVVMAGLPCIRSYKMRIILVLTITFLFWLIYTIVGFHNKKYNFGDTLQFYQEQVKKEQRLTYILGCVYLICLLFL